MLNACKVIKSLLKNEERILQEYVVEKINGRDVVVLIHPPNTIQQFILELGVI